MLPTVVLEPSGTEQALKQRLDEMTWVLHVEMVVGDPSPRLPVHHSRQRQMRNNLSLTFWPILS